MSELKSLEEYERESNEQYEKDRQASIERMRANYPIIKVLKEAGYDVWCNSDPTWCNIHLGQLPDRDQPEARRQFYQKLSRIKHLIGIPLELRSKYACYLGWEEKGAEVRLVPKGYRGIEIVYKMKLEPDGPCQVKEVQTTNHVLVCRT